MREVQPNGIEQQEAWIPDGLQEALGSDRLQTMDELWGGGEIHFFGPIGECSLTLHPEHQTIEYENLETYIVFKKPSRLTVAEDTVYIDTPGETQSSYLVVDRDGGVLLVIKPVRIPEIDDRLNGAEASAEVAMRVTNPEAGWSPASPVQPITSKTAKGEEILQHVPTDGEIPPEEPPISASVAPWEVERSSSGSAEYPIRQPEIQQDSRAKASTSSPEPAKEKKPRVDFTGRIGRLPTFKSTKTGKRMARFPVAEHVPDEEGDIKTVWYNVAVFNAIAEKLEAQIKSAELAVGDEIHVAGYRQQTHVPDGRGGLREQEVIFAAHVGRSKQKREER